MLKIGQNREISKGVNLPFFLGGKKKVELSRVSDVEFHGEFIFRTFEAIWEKKWVRMPLKLNLRNRRWSHRIADQILDRFRI